MRPKTSLRTNQTEATMFAIPFESIISPRSTSSSAIHGMPMDELYDERRSLRNEWIRFMDSMDSCDDDATTSTNDGENDNYRVVDEMGESELCYPTTRNAHLDRIFSGRKNDDRDRHNRNYGDYDVLDTFRSLKAQVVHLGGILDEFTDLPKSPAKKSSPAKVLKEKPIEQTTKFTRLGQTEPFTKNTFKKGLYDGCDNFEDEWEALDKLEMELRQELETFGMKLENKNYEKENTNLEIENQSSCPELVDENDDEDDQQESILSRSPINSIERDNDQCLEFVDDEGDQQEPSRSKSPVNPIECDDEQCPDLVDENDGEDDQQAPIVSRSPANQIECDDEQFPDLVDENEDEKDEPEQIKSESPVNPIKRDDEQCPELVDEDQEEDKEAELKQSKPKSPVNPIECDEECIESVVDRSDPTTITMTERDQTPTVSNLASQSSEEESTSSMFMNCVSCTPRACSVVLDEDKDEYWDPIAAQRIRYDPSIPLSAESLLPDREKLLSPIYETNIQRNAFSSPISTLSTFTKDDAEPINSSENPMKSIFDATLSPDSSKIMVPVFESSPNGDEDVLGQTITSSESSPSECKSANIIADENPTTTSPKDSISKAPNNSVSKPTSYTMMVPTDSNEVIGKMEKKIDCKQENPVDESNDCESRDELNHVDSDILVVPTKSASTLTREEGPSTDSLDSHDEILNEILLEDETLTQRSKSQNSACANDTEVLEQNVILEDILSERDEDSVDNESNNETEEIQHEPVKVPTPRSPFHTYPAKLPANHQRSITINNFDRAQSRSPFSRIQKSPVRSPISTNKDTPFMSPYMAFELDVLPDPSLDLMAPSASVDCGSPAKRSFGTTIMRKEPLTMPSTVKELALLDTESDEDYISPLTSPTMFEDAIKEKTDVDDLVGQICAKVGNVLVLDQGEQGNKASKVPHPNTVSEGRNEIHSDDLNGIETVLAEEPKEFCNMEESKSTPPSTEKDLLKKGEEDALQFNISEIDSNESPDKHTSLGASSKHCHKEGQDEADSNDTTVGLETKIFTLNQQLLDSIVSRNFAEYSDLTMETISGIDWQGEILNGQSVHWKAEQLLRTPLGIEDGEKCSLLENKVSMEQCSIQQLSQDVVIAICRFSESLTRNCFRETRIWKMTAKGHWKNCHVHRHCLFP